MAQAIDVPILEIPSIQKVMTIEELSSMWNVFSKCKNSIENGRRLENLSWRLWYRESSLHHHPSSVSICSTFGPSTPKDNDTMDMHHLHHHDNEFNHQNKNNIIYITNNEEIKENLYQSSLQQQQQQQQHKSKFFVDNSDTEDDDDDEKEEEEDEEEFIENDHDDDDMWSTYESNHEGKQYLEQAYKKKFTLSSISTISTMTTATTLDEEEEEEGMIESPLRYNHHCLSKPIFHHHYHSQQQKQQQPSLLSKLLKQQQLNKNNHDHHDYNIPPELPPTLQSCVDWEKTQNMLIPCKLGQSPILPDENIIW